MFTHLFSSVLPILHGIRTIAADRNCILFNTNTLRCDAVLFLGQNPFASLHVQSLRFNSANRKIERDREREKKSIILFFSKSCISIRVENVKMMGKNAIRDELSFLVVAADSLLFVCTPRTEPYV